MCPKLLGCPKLLLTLLNKALTVSVLVPFKMTNKVLSRTAVSACPSNSNFPERLSYRFLCSAKEHFRAILHTVVGETLAVFRLPQIRKNGQCLDGQVGKTFLEIFGGNHNFSKFREAKNGLFFPYF